jgi:hypothetical protein
MYKEISFWNCSAEVSSQDASKNTYFYNKIEKKTFSIQMDRQCDRVACWTALIYNIILKAKDLNEYILQHREYVHY